MLFLFARMIISEANSIPGDASGIRSSAFRDTSRIPQCASVMPGRYTSRSIPESRKFPTRRHQIMAPGWISPRSLEPITNSVPSFIWSRNDGSSPKL